MKLSVEVIDLKSEVKFEIRLRFFEGWRLSPTHIIKPISHRECSGTRSSRLKGGGASADLLHVRSTHSCRSPERDESQLDDVAPEQWTVQEQDGPNEVCCMIDTFGYL